ncbi:hypothetical protein V1508DRAFT_395368 [Lipomyces doorenjongii]|uniref:uncharacterized protein n=1 Tax=Lipomyces doorenjongii TaxID=383834 RepID=UPI0034CE75F7
MPKKRRQEQKEKSDVAEVDTDVKQALGSFLVRFDTVNAEVIARKSENSHEKRRVEDRREDLEATRLVRDKMIASIR